ncbi:hypothetical protein SAMN04489712_101571 [Thermomonospora echinospora]|uniref:Uncharacterized protein n=1 Tax=Thermomonospora echinospora TaxID=1992 RepID=A0A1H5TCZ7_9ACTN|nr:hypothetical protein [Thermomonospora echinospora]SEF60669.1 hypothetical protein SAMN04489712_101571 [Thermomonospora echinospora]
MPVAVLLGVGTARSPRFAPAGLLVEYGHVRVGLDGGPGSEPPENVDAWLVRDEDDPLQPGRVRLAAEEGMARPVTGSFHQGTLHVEPLPVRCGERRMHGYRIAVGRRVAVWAPEFTEFPPWAEGADLVFADATAWDAGAEGTGAPASVPTVRWLGVRRLVFARLGEAAYGAVDSGRAPPFGEWGEEGRKYRI